LQEENHGSPGSIAGAGRRRREPISFDRQNENNYRSHVKSTPPAASNPCPEIARPQAGAGNIPRVASFELLGERGVLIIDHGGREYRLRITQNGKLILTA
jgi:hemin uptake protein HemP